jgi:hypothetical protein
MIAKSENDEKSRFMDIAAPPKDSIFNITNPDAKRVNG